MMLEFVMPRESFIALVTCVGSLTSMDELVAGQMGGTFETAGAEVAFKFALFLSPSTQFWYFFATFVGRKLLRKIHRNMWHRPTRLTSTSGVLSGDSELVQFCITSSDVLITVSAKEKTYVAGVVVNESVNLFSLFRLFLFLRVWREELSSRFYFLHPCNPQRLVFVLCILCLSRDCSFQFGGSIKRRSQNVEEWKN